MSQARTLKTVFIPPPIGGWNSRDPRMMIADNEATVLRNYTPYSNSIRSCRQLTNGVDLTGTESPKGLHNWQTAAFAERVIATTDTKIWSITSGWAATDITGAVAMTNGATSGISFNGYLFLCNGTNPVCRVDTALATSAAAFVGPGGVDTTLNQVWSYKGRLYFIEKASTSFWYGELLFVTGTLTEIDEATILDKNSNLLFGATWTVNNGASYEEYCVLVSAFGEVLVYSGDYPGAPNWYLTARTRIPTPLGRRAFTKLGGDILIYTKIGIVKLSDIVSTASAETSFYTISNKISRTFQNPNNLPSDPDRALMAVETDLPFVHVLTYSFGIYSFNYETGAWFEQYLSIVPDCIVYAFGLLLLGNSGGIEIRYLKASGVGASGAPSRSWSTGWMDFGSRNIKKLAAVRLLSASTSDGTTDDTTYQISVGRDFRSDSSNNSHESKIVTSDHSSQDVVYSEFRPGIMGTWLSFGITTADGAMDEIYGLEVQYEEGGVYGSNIS